jgi:hypothetical protein
MDTDVAMKINMESNNLNAHNTKKNLEHWSIRILQINIKYSPVKMTLENWFFQADATFKFKNKPSSVKVIF